MTEFSGANDSSGFDGNTILLECQDKEYVYIYGLEIFKFKSDDKIINYISLMSHNMVPYAIIFGEKYTYFIVHHYKFIENDKIEEGTLLNATNNNLDPFLCRLSKFGKDSFEKLERILIHTFWPGVGEAIENEYDDLVEEDEENGDDVEDGDLIETPYLNGNNEVVEIFNQKCVICYERDSVYAFKLCGHHCICENCHQKSVILIY